MFVWSRIRTIKLTLQSRKAVLPLPGTFLGGRKLNIVFWINLSFHSTMKYYPEDHWIFLIWIKTVLSQKSICWMLIVFCWKYICWLIDWMIKKMFLCIATLRTIVNWNKTLTARLTVAKNGSYWWQYFVTFPLWVHIKYGNFVMFWTLFFLITHLLSMLSLEISDLWWWPSYVFTFIITSKELQCY